MAQDVLEVVDGQDQGARFALGGPAATIGRDPAMDIVLTDPRVSRRHATLRVEGTSLVVEDLGSTSGTLVNGQRVAAPTALRAGDRLKIGQTEMSVLWTPGGAPAGPAVTEAGRLPEPGSPPRTELPDDQATQAVPAVPTAAVPAVPAVPTVATPAAASPPPAQPPSFEKPPSFDTPPDYQPTAEFRAPTPPTPPPPGPQGQYQQPPAGDAHQPTPQYQQPPPAPPPYGAPPGYGGQGSDQWSQNRLPAAPSRGANLVLAILAVLGAALAIVLVFVSFAGDGTIWEADDRLLRYHALAAGGLAAVAALLWLVSSFVAGTGGGRSRLAAVTAATGGLVLGIAVYFFVLDPGDANVDLYLLLGAGALVVVVGVIGAIVGQPAGGLSLGRVGGLLVGLGGVIAGAGAGIGTFLDWFKAGGQTVSGTSEFFAGYAVLGCAIAAALAGIVTLVMAMSGGGRAAIALGAVTLGGSAATLSAALVAFTALSDSDRDVIAIQIGLILALAGAGLGLLMGLIGVLQARSGTAAPAPPQPQRY